VRAVIEHAGRCAVGVGEDALAAALRPETVGALHRIGAPAQLLLYLEAHTEAADSAGATYLARGGDMELLREKVPVRRAGAHVPTNVGSAAQERAAAGEIFADTGAERGGEGLEAAEVVAAAFLQAHEGEPLVIVDAPLLLECGWEKLVDQVWVVSISEEEQIRRAMARSGMSRQEGVDRIHRQMPLAEKTKQADVVIDNSGGLEQLYKQVDALLDVRRETCV